MNTQKHKENKMIKIDQEKCNGCGSCVDVCPCDALSVTDGKCKVDNDACTECEACIGECPTQAISNE